MVHLVIGLFKNEKQATDAILELKASKSSGDISVIAREELSGNIHIHQVKEIPCEELTGGEKRGTIIGMVGGLLIGLFLIPTTKSVGIMAIALGVIGAIIGTLTGAVFGSYNKAGLHPERAKMYKDKIKKGEVFVSVSTSAQHEKELKSIFTKHNVSEIESVKSAV
jgi:uncharacterized membrane protein